MYDSPKYLISHSTFRSHNLAPRRGAEDDDLEDDLLGDLGAEA